MKALVIKAWDQTGRHGHNDCTGHDIKSAFRKPEFLDSFLDFFPNTKGGNLDGTLTKDQFEKAFVELQICVPDLSMCITKIKEIWGVDEHASASVDRCRVDTIIK